MSKYYYHPLGDYAQYFIDNYDKWVADDIDTRQTFPHTYNGHGWGQLDWGVPAELPVYSMTDGNIISIWTGSGRGNGLWVVVKTDRTDGTGKPVCITYGELEGLSDITAKLCGAQAGPANLQNVSWSGSEPVKMGDMLGYTNAFNEYDFSNMHTDWHYEGTFDNNDQGSHCTVEGATLDSAFDVDSNHKVTVNGLILGPDDGIMSPLQTGPSGSETLYPTLQSMVMLQKPIKRTAKQSNSISDGMKLDRSKVKYAENMNQEALDFYFNGIMSDKWMGPYPETLEILNDPNNGIRYATAIANHELNFDIFSGTSYGKLMRTKMIGETWNEGDTMAEWFQKVSSSAFQGKDSWLQENLREDELQFAQILYNNIKYPDLFGEQYATISEKFKSAVIEACTQVPILNPYPIQYGPHAFIVNFNPRTDRDEGEFTTGEDNYLLYRSQTGNLTAFNKKIIAE